MSWLDPFYTHGKSVHQISRQPCTERLIPLAHNLKANTFRTAFMYSGNMATRGLNLRYLSICFNSLAAGWSPCFAACCNHSLAWAVSPRSL